MWGPTMLGTCQIERYRSDGFSTGIRVMNREETRRYRNSFDELEAEQGREVSQNGMTDAHLDHRFVWEIGTHPRILECVTDLIGPDVLLLGSHFFCKYGPEEKFVAWHQDLRYWGLEPLLSVSVWYAVDDSDLENGCLRVIPGSGQRLLGECLIWKVRGSRRRTGSLRPNWRDRPQLPSALRVATDRSTGFVTKVTPIVGGPVRARAGNSRSGRYSSSLSDLTVANLVSH